jgi:hypothetical protein
MDAKPVKRYRSPAYPTRLAVLDDPDLLLRHVPGRWQKSAVTMAALSAFLAANACVQAADKGASAKAKGAVVAPIFEHGDGRGATGCVVVTPPVFLSEEEALVVITAELAKAGVRVTGKNVLLDGVRLPQAPPVALAKDGAPLLTATAGLKARLVPGPGIPLEADIVANGQKVAVEYVSAREQQSLGAVRRNILSSVQGHDTKSIAAHVAKEVAKQGKDIHFGAFYDPIIGLELDWDKVEKLKTAAEHREFREKSMAKCRLEAKRLLRLQVKDFVDWLKGQGVI